MCGIAAIVGSQDARWMDAMLRVIRRRGPDDQGVHRTADGGVSLGMRRLSIIDLAGGHQPMSNEDGTVWIVFNGEIYNAPELRLDLERRGHRFATDHSDTEVLVHLYEDRKEAMLDALNGMFAFAIYDGRARTLFAARDCVGIKPLYYARRPGLLACASEMKCLLCLPQVARAVDHESLYHYFTLLYVPGEASILQDVTRLPAAHWLRHDQDSGEVVVRRYWAPRAAETTTLPEAEHARRLRHTLRAAVRRWTRSDVPVACSLSGGVDSSALVGLLSETGAERVRTYCVGFAGGGEEPWDETRLARRVAERWGTDHHEITVSPESLLDDLVRMVWFLDEPYGGGLPAWHVFREMSRDVKVGLTGTGGDELFGNYGKYVALEQSRVVRAALALHRRAPAAARLLGRAAAPLAGLARPAAAPGRHAASVRERLARAAEMLRCPFGASYYAQRLYFSDAQKRHYVFAANADGGADTAAFLQNAYSAVGARNPRDGLLAVDFGAQLAEEFLLMTDRFSMAHSLEARVPLLDRELVEQALQIPAEMRSRPDDLKYLLKRAVRDLLPAEIVEAPKRGFVLPVELWLRRELADLVRALMRPERLRAQGLFREDFLARYALPHIEGRATCTWQVWAMLMFQLWHVVFVERAEKDVPSFGWRDLCSA